jgi:lipoyl-dependent peroxiredoxin
MPTRNASAAWEGGLRGGKGTFEGESGAIQGRYSFGSRFEESGGSNPEELLAAAEAACFSMALSGALEKQGVSPERVSTKAACTVEKVGDGFKITRMHLTVRVRADGIDDAAFQEAARGTKEGCPVSKALAGNVEIELDAALE